MSRTFMDFLKSRLGQNFTVCSLDEYKLNGFSKEWAAEQQPRKETMRVTQAATEFEFKAPVKIKALIGFDHVKELGAAAISMKVYINAMAETKALALDKKDYFEKSRESWNEHQDRVLSKLGCMGRMELNETYDIWRTARNPVKVLADRQHEYHKERVNENRNNTNSIFYHMETPAIIDYLATKYRLDVLELRARKKMKNI